MGHFYENLHNIIILDQDLLPLILPYLPKANNIVYYAHNCREDPDLLVACGRGHRTLILNVYNKVVMEFEVFLPGQTLQALATEVIEWVHRGVAASPSRDLSPAEIMAKLEDKRELFLAVANKSVHDLEVAYIALSKQFWFCGTA
jgi:hypothetical protein